MFYRHILTSHRDAIEATFVFESHHGDPYAGHDDDGSTRIVEVGKAPFAARLEAVIHAYPNPTRDALYAAMWTAAEQQLLAEGQQCAGTTLPPYHAPSNLPTLARLNELAEEFAFLDRLKARAAETPQTQA